MVRKMNWFQRENMGGERPAGQTRVGHIPRNLDLIFCPAIIWYQTGYSTFTLRQASRRSWRIGQTKPVTVRFLCYENTAQVGCLRLMGRKLLVSMALEGKFSDSGLQAMDDGADVLTTLARESVELLAKLDTGAAGCIFERKYAEMLGLDVESGRLQRFRTVTGSFNAFPHEVTIQTLDMEFSAPVYFAQDPIFSRNFLGRTGWLDRVRIAIIDYDRLLFLSAY